MNMDKNLYLNTYNKNKYTLSTYQLKGLIAPMAEKNSSALGLSTGRRIKMARTLAGISRKDLEEKHGISIHTLQSWELGRNPLTEKTAAKLIDIFHSTGVSCSKKWLLEGVGKSPSLLDSEFVPYPSGDKDIAPLLAKEGAIQKEVDFFKTHNPNAVVIMVSDETMSPRYMQGDFVGGIQYHTAQEINDCLGHDCIIETSEGTFFRRFMQRKSGYALVSLNPQTTIDDPVIFTKHVLAAAPVIWHRWKFKKPE